MHQCREHDKDLREVKLESATEAITIQSLDTQRVAIKELVQACQSFITEHFLPKLKLDYESDDKQTLRVEENKEPKYFAWALLLKHTVTKDGYRVDHVKPSCLHECCKQHHKVAKQLTVADQSFVGDNQVTFEH